MNKQITRSSDVELTFDSKTARAYLAEPENGGPGILLLHAWWGLKPFFKETCDRLAEQGFVVLAPDLRNGQIAKTIDEAKQMMQKSDSQETANIITAARTYLFHMPGRKGETIGVIGFSMGAAWALVVAAHKPEQIAATVLFYGPDDMDIGSMQSKVLGHYSDVDEWQPYDEVQRLEKRMSDAGVVVQFYTYPGRPHWFVEEDRPEYDPDAARLAWERTFEFLKENL
jgi:carboxymethylenebutenolidase